MAGGAEICKIVIAIFLPPVAVLLERGCGADLIINILLTLLGHIPGVIHAIYLILHDRERRKDGQMLYPPRHQQNNHAMYGQGPGYRSKDTPAAEPVYREQPVNYNDNNIQAVPPTYGDYTERDIAGNRAASIHDEKHEYAPVTNAPPPQNYQNYTTKEV